MPTPTPGGTLRISSDRAFTDLTDGNGQPLKFEEKKDSKGDFEAKGSDGNLSSFSIKGAIVEVNTTAAVDNKELRRRFPGIPLPKEEAKKIDSEIKKENEERAELAKQGTSPEAKSLEKRAYIGDEIGPRVVETDTTKKSENQSQSQSQTKQVGRPRS
jgi:hypothetical protein